MGNVNLPRASSGDFVQILGPDTAGAVQGTIGATSARVAIPSGAKIIRVAASQTCFLNFGDSTVEASSGDMYFPSGVEYFSVESGITHIAFIEIGAAGGLLNVVKLA